MALATPHPHAPPGLPVTKPTARIPSSTQSLTSNNPSLAASNVTLVPLSLSHVDSLWKNLQGAENYDIWKFIPAGPFDTLEEFKGIVEFLIHDPKGSMGDDGQAYAIVLSPSPNDQGNGNGEGEGDAVGIIRLLNMRAAHLSVEIGYVVFSKRLQKTVEATMTFYLLIKYVIEELGCERVEWKCNLLNAGSSRAARRLGFSPEGVFRKHLVVKGVWRDTWWGSILGEEWRGEVEGRKGVKEVLEKWLDKSNFDENGRQKCKMEEFR